MSSADKTNGSKLNEILGVVLIGLAALAAVAVYFDAGGVFGSFSRDFVFGMSGSFGYLLPIILGAAGVYAIAARRSPVHNGKRLLFALGILVLISMWHLGVAGLISLPNGTYGMFLGDSYEIGAATRTGGGVLGALLTYWTTTYLGIEGSWVVLIVALAVCVLAVTNLSIRKLSKDLGTAVRTSYEEHRTRSDEARERIRAFHQNKTHDPSRVPASDNPFDMRVQPLEVKRKVGGRRKSAPQPELDPPFSLAQKAPRKAPPASDFVDNVINLSEHRSTRGARRAASAPEQQIPADTAEVPAAVNGVGLPPEAEMNYDPEPYREVFADTDIQFDDDAVPEVRAKRRIDPELVERVTGKYAKVSVAPPAAHQAAYHIETGQNRAGTAAAVAADTGRRTAPAKPPEGYVLPSLELLNRPQPRVRRSGTSEVQKNAALLEETLATFNIEAHVEDILEGPVVTRYELKLAPGVQVNRVVRLAQNLGMALAASSIRIEAPVPGKSVVGIEIPNAERESVGLRELLENPKYASLSSPLAFALGKDITGTPVYADITKMPHLLVAGQTGAGKSVCINSLIISILYRCSPEDVQMLMIDPKQVELSGYNDIPHLLSSVVTDPKKAPYALNWAVNEMNQRYNLIAKRNVRGLDAYNDLLIAEGQKKLPHILIIVDELAELMMTSGKEVEEAIQRIAQLGRAAGIHLVIATQRPVVKVITGLIKANVPGRIAFSVKSSVDSKTILDSAGAEKLLGRGDMLFYTTGLAAPERIQGCNVTDAEIERVVEHVKNQQGTWKTRVEFEEDERDNGSQMLGDTEESGRDRLFFEAMRVAVENEGVSTSFLQRRLRIGYGRAARLLDELEMDGVISGPNGSKAREVLISREEFERLYGDDEEEEEL